MDRQEHTDADAAIYYYQEYWEGGKGWGEDEPHIIGLGPNIVTTPRHFRQQSWYAICRVLQNGWHSYANHKEVFQKADVYQDVLKKYTIPASQRKEFLDRLSLMNITAYTLFGNEEGLMETLAYRAIISKTL